MQYIVGICSKGGGPRYGSSFKYTRVGGYHLRWIQANLNSLDRHVEAEICDTDDLDSDDPLLSSSSESESTGSESESASSESESSRSESQSQSSDGSRSESESRGSSRGSDISSSDASSSGS